MGAHLLEALADVAARQAGVFSLAQAENAGVSRPRVRRAAQRGVLVQVGGRVYRVAGSPASHRAALWTAHLQLGEDSLLSHESALDLNGVDRVPAGIALTIGPSGRREHPGTRVHRLGDLLPEHRLLVEGLPTTTLARAVVDVTSIYSLGRLAYVLDQITVVERRVTLGEIARTLRQVNRRGRQHIARLGMLLDERSPGEATPRSRLERRCDDLLATGPLPRPEREHPLPSSRGMPGLVDRCWPTAKLLLEIDGRRWHARERDMARDRARDREAARLGWLTVRVLDEEVGDCPGSVMEDLVEIYRERRAGVQAA
ncbi:MAG TPA: type IV toxin-antitoxin system AbiEi family antitoxin domain-containing protein [Microthrixaceae bacterium]|nr:type IV toxin-antitoxin system AbiEi family antitoxin domain-containing protein [Microthrixaceae bacterium]